MEKLIRLLNEYENTDNWENGHQVEFRENKIISKKFGFIQRLVENDKIGRNKNSDRSAILDLMRVEIKEQTDAFEGVEKYEWYIMVLSIRDDPINFLIDILK